MSYTNYNHVDRRNRITEPAQLLGSADLWTPTADQKYMLGTIFDLNDGRRFRYQKAGAVALTAGYCNQSAVGTANWQNEAQTNGSAWAIGDQKVTIVLSSTATADQFREGYLTIEDGTGEGQMYLIKTNKAGTANATSGFDIVTEIADDGGIRVATVVGSEVTVTLNKYDSVFVFPTNPTGVATGVNPVAVTASYYFWGQTLGPCPVVVGATDTIVVGDAVGIGTATTAGAACLLDVAAALEGDVLLGYVMRAAATGETALIDLHLE